MRGWCTPGPAGVLDMLQTHTNDASMLLHIGDIAYAVGFAPMRWEQLFYQMENISSYLP